MIEILTNAFIVACIAASGFFVIGYGFSAPWWRSDTGRHFFSFGLLLFLTFALIGVSAFFGTNWFGRPVVRMVAFGAFALVLLWRNHVFVSAQLKRSNDSGSEDRNGTESLHG